MNISRPHSPAFWVPTLYFAEGIPAAIICEVSIVIFTLCQWDAAKTTMAVSSLGLVWLVKFFWAPAVDTFATKKHWIVGTQLALGAVFFVATICLADGRGNALFGLFALAAVLSATSDIACDGFYIIALDAPTQALYSGWRSVFYRIAMVAANGGIPFLLAAETPWVKRFALLPAGILFILLGIYHYFILPGKEQKAQTQNEPGFFAAFAAFFRREKLGKFLLFLLLYRFAEAQLGGVSKIFLLDSAGAAMPLKSYSLAVGSFGVLAMLAGGVLGGVYASRVGLKQALLPMALALNLPDAVYLVWAYFPLPGFALPAAAIAVEQFGYGLGFTGYMLMMIYFAEGSGIYRTSHFALLTGFMLLGLRLPGMWSGKLLEILPQLLPHAGSSYQLFFLWIMISTIVSFAVTLMIRDEIPASYGKVENNRK